MIVHASNEKESKWKHEHRRPLISPLPPLIVVIPQNVTFIRIKGFRREVYRVGEERSE